MKTSTVVFFVLLGLASSAQTGFKHARRQDGVFPPVGDVLTGDAELNSITSDTNTGDSSSSGSAATTSADSAAASTPSAPSTTPGSSQAAPTTAQSLTISTPQTTPSSVTQHSISDSQSTSSSSSSTSQTSTPSTTPTSVQTSSGFRTTSIALHTFVTTANGVVTTGVSTSSFIITPSSTALASDSSSGNSGLSTKTRSTIIGIVCGIAGAVVLGSLILMARRIFAGRRNKAPEDDGMMEYNGFNGGMASREKESYSAVGSAGTVASPFQSTLESYHNPAKGSNVSSNF